MLFNDHFILLQLSMVFMGHTFRLVATLLLLGARLVFAAPAATATAAHQALRCSDHLLVSRAKTM
jgi:hypothetical protein